MISSIPGRLQKKIKADLSEKLNISFELRDFSFSSGGCINHTGALQTDKGWFFLKWNSGKRFPDMFEKEAQGLDLLQNATGLLKIPEVIIHGDDGENIYILMENIAEGVRGSDYWEILGHGLAELHRNISEKHGLQCDNYIGSLHQFNSTKSNWIEFFIENRLEKPFIMAYDRGLLDSNVRRALYNLIKELPNICPRETKASLIHGDLWSGNLMIGTEGKPCLIDPAVYYGFREMEIAFTQLFGRYSDTFYQTYNETWPLEAGFEERIDIWNLYPLLVHVNLFGAGYARSVKQILHRFT